MTETVSDVGVFSEPSFDDTSRYSSVESTEDQDQEPSSTEEYDDSLSYYDMSRDKYLIIFNHFEYEDSRYFNYKKPSTRTGTYADVERLEELFGNLGFEVKTHHDLKHSDILDTVVEFSKRDHKETSCVCFIFLTHGDRCDDLYAFDKPYQFRDITRMMEDGDDGLLGKPKLFFIQACRGKQLDDGRSLQIDGCEASILIPTHADFLILYSTVEDYVSFRDIYGSFMIQELCKVIEEYHKSWDLLHIITLLNKRVAYNRVTNAPSNLKFDNKKQMPEARYSLTKLLKF